MTYINPHAILALKARTAINGSVPMALVPEAAVEDAVAFIESVLADRAAAGDDIPSIILRPMKTAPRDGTTVYIYERAGQAIEATLARVVTQWVTDEFIPIDISSNDFSGMNHGAISESNALGWLPRK